MVTKIDKRLTDEQRAMVEANVGLVYGFVLRRYGREHPKHDDLVQAGVFGLMRAAQKYDPAKAKFSTYANYWIRQATQRYINEDTLIRVPSHAAEDARRGRGKHLKQIETAHGATRFDATNDAFHPAVVDDAARAVEAADERETAARRLRRALPRLPERHRDILLRRATGETLKAISATWGVGRERIRQIETEAMDRLRYEMGATI